MDTCRADIFYELLDEGALPGIRQIVSDARIYRNAEAVAPWTVPSHASMFSGLYPADHGSSADDPYFDPPTTPLADRLRRSGYETAALSANPWITPTFDFTTGFERFKTQNEWFWDGADISGLGGLGPSHQITEIFDRMSLDNAPQTVVNALYSKLLSKRNDSGAKRLTSDAVRWLTGRTSGDPFFLFCNFTEPHLEYDPPLEFVLEELPDGIDTKTARSVNQDQWAYIVGQVEMSERDFDILRALYRGAIRYLDSQLDRLFEVLASEGLLDQTAIVLVSDHGENIGDHELMDHQYCLYETLLHVPLVIRYPELFEAGTDRSLVETHQLYETIADLAGLKGSETGTAPSLVDFDQGSEYAIAEYTAPQPSLQRLAEEYGPLHDDVWRYDRSLRSIRSEAWKYIEGSDGSSALYDLQADPDEEAPVTRGDAREELQRRLERRRGSLTAPSKEHDSVDTPNTQRLRDLGYL